MYTNKIILQEDMCIIGKKKNLKAMLTV